MANRWDGVQKAAMQILGPQGKIPEIPDALHKAMEGSQKSWAEFQAASKSLKDKLDAHEQKYDIHLSALRGFADEINGDDLGLDPKKNKDDLKKIVAARKLLAKYWNDVAQQQEKGFNDLKKLDAAVKILMDAK